MRVEFWLEIQRVSGEWVRIRKFSNEMDAIQAIMTQSEENEKHEINVNEYWHIRKVYVI